MRMGFGQHQVCTPCGGDTQQALAGLIDTGAVRFGGAVQRADDHGCRGWQAKFFCDCVRQGSGHVGGGYDLWQHVGRQFRQAAQPLAPLPGPRVVQLRRDGRRRISHAPPHEPPQQVVLGQQHAPHLRPDAWFVAADPDQVWQRPGGRDPLMRQLKNFVAALALQFSDLLV